MVDDDELDAQMGALDLQTNESEEKKESLEAFIEKDNENEEVHEKSQKNRVLRDVFLILFPQFRLKREFHW